MTRLPLFTPVSLTNIICFSELCLYIVEKFVQLMEGVGEKDGVPGVCPVFPSTVHLKLKSTCVQPVKRFESFFWGTF